MKRATIYGLIVLTLSMTSCADNGPQIAKIEGTVKVDGQPLARGKIMMSSEIGRQSVGDVVDGKIENVTTISEGDGAVVGINRVAIRPSVDESLMMKEPVKAAEAIKGSGVPRKYYSLSTTELKLEVKNLKTNKLYIEISSELDE